MFVSCIFYACLFYIHLYLLNLHYVCTSHITRFLLYFLKNHGQPLKVPSPQITKYLLASRSLLHLSELIIMVHLNTYIYFYMFFFLVLGMESRALHMPGKYSTIGIHPSPYIYLHFKKENSELESRKSQKLILNWQKGFY
jgi:hypothetical protein